MNSFKFRVARLLSNSFVKDVSVLLKGTVLSQLILIASLPVLTRLYDPSEFGVLAVLVAIISIFGAIACLRFEIAIPMPRDEDDALALLCLSLISATIVTALIAVGLFFLFPYVNGWTGHSLGSYLWLLPPGVFLVGVYNALQFWMTRKKNFKVIATTRVSQSVFGSGSQLTFGFFGLGVPGLLMGQMLFYSAGIVSLLKKFMGEPANQLHRVKLESLKSVFKRYDRFPKYSTWEALTNSAAIQIPVILIAALAAGAEVGFLMLAMRLLSAPMSLIGGSIAQVYLSEAARKHHEGALEYFTKRTIWQLAKIGFLPLLFVMIFSPFAVPLIFGSDWSRTGVLISWMAPWFFMQFITSPVSMSLHITDNQKAALLLQFIGLAIRVGAVSLCYLFANEWIGESYAVSGFVFYTLYLFVVIKYARS